MSLALEADYEEIHVPAFCILPGDLRVMTNALVLNVLEHTDANEDSWVTIMWLNAQGFVVESTFGRSAGFSMRRFAG